MLGHRTADLPAGCHVLHAYWGEPDCTTEKQSVKWDTSPGPVSDTVCLDLPGNLISLSLIICLDLEKNYIVVVNVPSVDNRRLYNLQNENKS